MPSIPLTDTERESVLQFLGISSTRDLFSSIPPRIQERADFSFPLDYGMSEHELRLYFGEKALLNQKHRMHFLGGGIYDNSIPAIVGQLALRGEFLTCYTPYQAEISQGTLSMIFEFQTMVTRLTQMNVANASMYDGATSMAEAVNMALRLNPGSKRVLIASSVPPDYLKVTRTFLEGHAPNLTLVRTGANGMMDLSHLKELSDANCLVVASPNYFGLVEDIESIRAITSATLIVVVPDPSSLGLFEAPGALGADIVCGELQQFGTPMTFGGPHVGFFATKKDFVRQMPGRLVGETIDNRGNRCYTLTLAAREQHIRREKATSNICTNQGLIALRTTIYLSFLGKQGLVNLAESNYSKFEYLKDGFEKKGIQLKYSGTHYREGVFEIPELESRFSSALKKGIIPGIRLKMHFGDSFQNSLLVTVHPKNDLSQIDQLIEVMT